MPKKSLIRAHILGGFVRSPITTAHSELALGNAECFT